MVAAAGFLNVHAARLGWTFLRNPLDGSERTLFVCFFCQALGLGAQVLFAQLTFVEKSVARETIAIMAQRAIHNVPVVFAEEGACCLLLASRSPTFILHVTYPKSKRRSGMRETLRLAAWLSWPCRRSIYLNGQPLRPKVPLTKRRACLLLISSNVPRQLASLRLYERLRALWAIHDSGACTIDLGLDVLIVAFEADVRAMLPTATLRMRSPWILVLGDVFEAN